MSAAPLRALVVEDSPTQAVELQLILESGGFAVDAAPHVEAAFERLERDPFDVVISDIVMPRLSGYDLCRRLKGDERWRRMPVLLLTSLTDPMDVIHALECGADSFMSKPCEPAHLLARVDGLLESRRLRAGADPAAGVDVLFNGSRFTIPSGKEQILDLLVSTFEDTTRKNHELLATRDALAHKHEQLLQAERQKEELSALLVHDLKSPAAGIMMAAKARLGGSSLSDRDRELWQMVYASAEVINRMVLNLLDISRSDGAVALRLARLDVAALIEQVRHLMEPLAENLHQQLDVFTEPGLPAIEADHELLRRVLQNLTDNSLRHGPPGTHVSISARLSGETMLRLEVADTGRGIPDGMRERIFEKYVRADQDGAASHGQGLGLAFCRLVADAHGGRIWVEDNPPQGSVFVIELPVGAAA